jgi:hypothetical protein
MGEGMREVNYAFGLQQEKYIKHFSHLGIDS